MLEGVYLLWNFVATQINKINVQQKRFYFTVHVFSVSSKF